MLDIPYESNKYVNLNNLIEEQRKKIVFQQNGKPFLSPLYINACIDTQANLDMREEYIDFLNKGYGHFVSDEIYFNDEKKEWCVIKPQDHSVSVTINIIDKIKVRSLFLSSANLSRQYCLLGSSRMNKKNNNKSSEMFLQEVSNSRCPVATWARYRNVENGLNIATLPNDVSINTINVNMPKGIHDHMLLLRAIACYHKSNNLDTRIVPLIDHFKLNNNSITVDSVLSCIGNEISFLDNCIGNRVGFKILPKIEFRTYKLIVPLDPIENSSTYHKNTDARKSIPVKGLEMQVHPRCLNCSAISGKRLLEIIKNIMVDLLNCAYLGKIKIDICLVNTKALAEKLSYSLIMPCLNDFCEFLCNFLGTKKMTIYDQMKTFTKTVAPILRKMFISRDNYAMCGPFANLTPLGNRLLLVNDSEIISHKYRNAETKHLFSLLNENDIKKVGLSKFMKKANEVKQSLQKNNNIRIKKKKDLKTKKRRTNGIVLKTSLGHMRYITALKKYKVDFPSVADI